MLNYLTEQIRKCRAKAKDCAQKAAAQTDSKLKQDLLNLEGYWLSVARSYAYHEQKSDLSEQTKRIDATTNILSMFVMLATRTGSTTPAWAFTKATCRERAR
jgi:hypothetical protein